MVSTEKPAKSNGHTKTPRKRKRAVEEVIAELPPLESVKFLPMQPASRDPIFNIPANINISSPYALFTLFFSEEFFQNISDSTNLYAKLKRDAGDTDDEAPELSGVEEEEEEEKEKEENPEISISSSSSIQQQPWKKTNPAEIKVFIGILLYMGVYKSQRTDLYWRNDLKQGPIHSIQSYMSHTRFKQLKRYIHISNPREARRPEAQNKDWWYKVEPLATEFHMACRKYYTPGSKVSIDEIMIKCFGRSQHTYKMPNKPIPRGYKIFGLAEHGYLWSFSWSSRRQSIMPMFQFPGLTKTGSMVVNLVNQLPIIAISTLNATPNATPNAMLNAAENEISISQQVSSYSIYMDNYFTSVPLFKELRQQGYGACGTTRPNQVPAILSELREHSTSKSIPWNILHAIEKENVLCLAWQDNNMVLALTTVHSLDAVIERTRKSPGELSTNANIVRKVFEGQPQKKLKIPVIIDDYNHHMNGVDLANQYRAAYTSHRVTYRTWLPIFYWLIDAAAVNAYRLQYIYMKQQGIPPKNLPSHIDFHEKLYQELFEFLPKIYDDLPPQRSNPDLNHQRISLPARAVCAWCRYKSKLGQQNAGRTGRSYSGCSACQNTPRCLKTRCWEEFHKMA